MTKKLKLEALNRVDLETFRLLKKNPITLVLDNIRSMHNVGAFFRTADAFLVEKILLTGITPRPPHREIHKAALGATESVEWSYSENIVSALECLKRENYKILGIEQATRSVFLQKYVISADQKYALVFGNEVEGISENALEFCDGCIEIAQSGTKHSLNVSVCGGIVMWEFYKAFSF
ncbi:MAG: RNA methyltransferase [Bergeyella sp.]|nr:RNA methyltransferase [Bergeyella sp.]